MDRITYILRMDPAIATESFTLTTPSLRDVTFEDGSLILSNQCKFRYARAIEIFNMATLTSRISSISHPYQKDGGRSCDCDSYRRRNGDRDRDTDSHDRSRNRGNPYCTGEDVVEDGYKEDRNFRVNATKTWLHYDTLFRVTR